MKRIAVCVFGLSLVVGACSVLAPLDDHGTGDAALNDAAVSEATVNEAAVDDGDPGDTLVVTDAEPADAGPKDGDAGSTDATSADASCAELGWTCVPAPDAGWAPTAFNGANADASCAPGWSDAGNVVLTAADGGGYTCACNCGAAIGCQPTLQLYSSTACGTASSVFKLRDAGLAGTCLKAESCPVGNVSEMTAVGTTVCPSGTGSASPPAPVVARAPTCGIQAQARGCATGKICVPPSPGFAVCAQKSGAALACPPGYQASSPRTVGTGPGFVDTRGCGSCACAGTCRVTSLDEYASTDCSGAVVQSATTTCTERVAPCLGSNASSFLIVATSPAQLACAPSSTASPQGGIALANAATICCAP